MAAAEPATLTRPAAAPPARLIVLLGALSTFGPLSMDMYLPGLPDLTRDLDAPAWAAQMTITTCMAGLAAGQLVAGPLSDRPRPRRPPRPRPGARAAAARFFAPPPTPP